MSDEFVDSNVLIYAHDSSAGSKQRIALELLRRLAHEETGALSVQVLTEFYSVSTRKLGMASRDAEQIISDLADWTIHEPTLTDVVRACDIHRSHQIAWWDALIIQSAERLGCEILWTEDLNDGQQYGSVRVRNPFPD